MINATRNQRFGQAPFFTLLLTFALWLLHHNALAAAPQQANSTKLTFKSVSQWEAIETEDVLLADGETASVKIVVSQRHPEHLYLWIGQAHSPNDGEAILLNTLKNSGTLWFYDTPDALFMSRSRTDMRNLPGAFVPNLMQAATEQFQTVTVISSDVGAVPTLRGLRQWQTQANAATRAKLKSVVLMFPSLYVNTPAAGEDRALFPISFETALPINIIQPELGAQTNFIHETVRALRMGGSLVTVTLMPNALDDHYHYEDIETMAPKTALAIEAGRKKIEATAAKLNYSVAQLSPTERLNNPPKSTIVRGLLPVEPPIAMPNIQLTDMNGHSVNVLKDYAGKALLVNFWATWCPHCVEEIPSMNNALAQLSDLPFDIVSISYRDSQAILEDFTQDVAVNFPVLMDRDGEVSAQWKVFAFPSTFLVDANGMIRYSINAGSIWDTPEMIEMLREVAEMPRTKTP